MDLQVIVNNFSFLIGQGFFGIGAFTGGTLRLAVPAMILGFMLGVFIGLARLSRFRWLRWLATIYVEFFRGVPLVMVIFWFWFVIPTLLGRSLPEYGVALTAFVIFEAAYLAEIVRAGIQSVARGQAEAATATGLGRAQTMRHVILPQALRNMLPALVTQFIVLLKDTSRADRQQSGDSPLRALFVHCAGLLAVQLRYVQLCAPFGKKPRPQLACARLLSRALYIDRLHLTGLQIEPSHFFTAHSNEKVTNRANTLNFEHLTLNGK